MLIKLLVMVNTVKSNTNVKKLPQTGAKQNDLALIGLAGMLGLGAKKKND